jgi:hypothetical protein
MGRVPDSDYPHVHGGRGRKPVYRMRKCGTSESGCGTHGVLFTFALYTIAAVNEGGLRVIQ